MNIRNEHWEVPLSQPEGEGDCTQARWWAVRNQMVCQGVESDRSMGQMGRAGVDQKEPGTRWEAKGVGPYRSGDQTGVGARWGS